MNWFILYLVAFLPLSLCSTLYVDGIGGYDDISCGNKTFMCKTITYGLTKAADGDIIILGKGTYNESVDLSKCVSIIGQEGSVVISGSIRAIHGTCGSLSLKTFSLLGNSSLLEINGGFSSSNMVVDGITFHRYWSNGDPLMILESSHIDSTISIQNCEFNFDESNSGDIVQLSGNHGYNLSFAHTSFKPRNVQTSSFALFRGTRAHSVVFRNVELSHGTFSLIDSADLIFEYNTMNTYNTGLTLRNIRSARIMANTFVLAKNTSEAVSSTQFYDYDELRITSNSFSMHDGSTAISISEQITSRPDRSHESMQNTLPSCANFSCIVIDYNAFLQAGGRYSSSYGVRLEDKDTSHSGIWVANGVGIEATFNFWGSADGPQVSRNESFSVPGVYISSNLDSYAPWCCSSSCRYFGSSTGILDCIDPIQVRSIVVTLSMLLLGYTMIALLTTYGVLQAILRPQK